MKKRTKITFLAVLGALYILLTAAELILLKIYGFWDSLSFKSVYELLIPLVVAVGYGTLYTFFRHLTRGKRIALLLSLAAAAFVHSALTVTFTEYFRYMLAGAGKSLVSCLGFYFSTAESAIWLPMAFGYSFAIIVFYFPDMTSCRDGGNRGIFDMIVEVFTEADGE